MSHLLAFVFGVGGGYVLAEWVRQAGASRRDAFLTLLGVLILALVAYATWTSYSNAAELAQIAECQRARNAEFADAIRARWQYADRENLAAIEHTQAIERFLEIVRAPGRPRAEVEAAFNEMAAASEAYERALRELADARLNTLSTEDCG